MEKLENIVIPKNTTNLSAMQMYNPLLKPQAKEEDKGFYTIDLLGEINEYWDWSAYWLKYELERANGRPVILNINSPGGSLFEGVAMYNMLRLYEGEVTARIIGLAASAATLPFLAAKYREVLPLSTLMIHNSWTFAMGNADELEKTAATMKQLDGAIAEEYSTISGKEVKEIKKLMAAETYLVGAAIMDNGFADNLIAHQAKEEDDPQIVAKHRADTLLAKAGVSRKERRELLKAISTQNAANTDNYIEDTQDAIPSGTQDATQEKENNKITFF
jgi:ATP-dependent Clp protease, protease subunit